MRDEWRYLKLCGVMVLGVALAGVVEPLQVHEDPQAQTWFMAPTPAPADFFGVDVAAEGGRILVGAMGTHGPGMQAGRAYLIEPAGDALWRQEVLMAPETRPFDLFGSRVAMTADLLIVGAHRSDAVAPDAGAVYVFEKNVAGLWQPTRLVPSDAQAGSAFGTDIAVEGDRILVGASLHRGVGAAYLFERATNGSWHETKIVASDGARGDQFGNAVAFLGDGFIVTANGRERHRGAAYVYGPDGAGGWNETLLRPADLEPYYYFGKSVAVSGDAFVIGAPMRSGYGLLPGSVYVYEPDGTGGWTSTRLGPNGFGYGDWPIYFGYSVAMHGSTVFAGVPGHDLPPYPELGIFNRYTDTGAVYMLRDEGENGWSQTILSAEPRMRSAQFGTSLALDADALLVGASAATGGFVSQPGAVFRLAAGCVLDEPGVPPLPSSVCDGPLGGG